VTVQDAFVRAGIAKYFFIKVTKLGVDGRERGDRMAFAEREHVLSGLGGVFDIEMKEAAIEKRDQGNCRREGSSGVETVIDGIATLPKRQDAYVGIFDGEQFKNAIAKESVPV
jgi:hypothetical protein